MIVQIQLTPVPTQPVQPGCNNEVIFASQQCKDAWDQYRDAVKERNDIITKNALLQAKQAGQDEIKQQAEQEIKRRDSDIAVLQARIAHDEPVLFWIGAGLGITAALLAVGLVRFVRSKFKISRREAAKAASA